MTMHSRRPNEIKSAGAGGEELDVETLTKAFDEFQASAAKRVTDLETALKAEKKQIDELEKRMGRMSLAGGGGDPDKAARLEAKAAATQYLRTGQVEGKGLRGGVDPDGGYTVLDSMSDVIQDQLINISPIRRIARVVQLGTGNGDYKQPIGRRGASSNWVGEETTRAATNTPNLAMVTPPGGEIQALASVTQWLLDDSSFDIENWLQSNILDEFAFQEGTAFINGNGISKPSGFLSGAPVTTADSSRAFGVLKYIATGNANDFASSNPGDKLIDLAFDLSAAYRPGASWVMNSVTASKIRKFKESTTNAYIWQPGLQAGQPDMLLGYPVTIAEDMPDASSGGFAVAFGNFQKGYLVVDKVGTRMIRDNITQPGWIRVIMFRRTYGAIADSNAIRLLKFATS